MYIAIPHCTRRPILKLELLASKPEFAEFAHAWRQQEMLLRHNPLKPKTLEELRGAMATESSDLSQFEDFESFHWFAKLGDDIVANVFLKCISRMMNYAEIGYGVPSALAALLCLPLLAGVLTVGVISFTWQAWRDGLWSRSGKLHYTAVTLGCGLFTGILHYWNLLGFRY